MIIVNTKNYKSSSESLKLAKKIEKVSSGTILAVSAFDAGYLKGKTKLKIFCQHLDFNEKGKTTGFLIPESAKALGVKGTLLNHSEHPLNEKEIKMTIKRAKSNGLKVVLCVKSVKEAKKYVRLKPFAIAFEDPKLISTKKSITKYRSKELLEFIKILKSSKTLALCGSGISSNEDYAKALSLGCKGVLVSSAIVNSKNPEKFFRKYRN